MCAKTPQKCAGQRNDPPMSEPSSSATKPAASAAAAPPDDPPGRARQVPRIVGGAVDLVVALPVFEHQRHVGLAENDGPGGLEPPHHERVETRLPIPELWIAPGRRQAGDVERLLDGHRQAEQWPGFAARQSVVGILGRLPRPLEIAHDDGVDRLVLSLDARDREIGQLDRGYLFGREGFDQLGGIAVSEVARCGGTARVIGRKRAPRQGAGRGRRPNANQQISPAWFDFHSPPSRSTRLLLPSLPLAHPAMRIVAFGGGFGVATLATTSPALALSKYLDAKPCVLEIACPGSGVVLSRARPGDRGIRIG